MRLEPYPQSKYPEAVYAPSLAYPAIDTLANNPIRSLIILGHAATPEPLGVGDQIAALNKLQGGANGTSFDH
ncbi:MAG TPA: hypothetical protein VLF43_01100 [Candidatus Saccharimonadales bacterium]|nr:hypothetical protein [Candidatus Saccharimonadales bacterium]